MRKFIYFTFLILLVSCSKDNLFPPEKVYIEEVGEVVVPNMSNVDVSARDHKVFANLKSNLKSGSPTKAYGDTSEELESLLDRSKARSLDIGSKTLIEVPFKGNYSNIEANLTLSLPDTFNVDSLSLIKMSLLDWYDNETMEHSLSVVTMIPYPDSYALDLNAEYSFIKAICFFRGILLFADINGTYLNSYEYLEGKSTELFVFDPSEVDDDGTETAAFISFPIGNSVTGTKANETVTYQYVQGCEIYLALSNAAVCIAESDSSGGSSSVYYISSRGSEIDDLLYGAGNYSYNNRTYGGGGGARSGANTSINKENYDNVPDHVKNLLPKLKGESDYISAVKKALADYCNTNSLMNHIVSLLDKYSDRLKEIEIMKLVTYKGLQVEGLTIPLGNGKYKIEIRGADLEASPFGVNLPVLLEELLHVVQYCADSNWTTGDMELEAKVMISIFQDQTQLSSGLSKDLITIFLDYYNNPKDGTYTAAVNALRGHPLWYTKEKFPLTPNRSHKERLKHIIFD